VESAVVPGVTANWTQKVVDLHVVLL